jgi:hypothetical protein
LEKSINASSSEGSISPFLKRDDWVMNERLLLVNESCNRCLPLYRLNFNKRCV